MNITIEIIPHSEQRYPTVGDWQITSDGLKIRVSKMSDERYCVLVAIHELIEAVLCRQHGVSEQLVDDFDVSFEQFRADGFVQEGYETDEPGDCTVAPYYAEHQIATGIERILAERLGVSWQDYKKEVNAL
jgi:hypothetical protein